MDDFLVHFADGTYVNLFTVEQHLVPWSWYEDLSAHLEIPAHALEAFRLSAEDGTPTGIAHHPEHGWCVIATAGQGPMLIWAEKELK